MTRYTLTFVQEDYEALQSHLAWAGAERAAYLICRLSVTADETRLLVTDLLPVEETDVISSSATHMQIAGASFRRAMKQADLKKSAFVFVHSHPSGHRTHSNQDDREEKSLFRTAHIRIKAASVHASLVFADGEVSAARVWLADGSVAPIERVRVIGTRFRFIWFDEEQTEEIPDFFDRQVRAFGADIQRLLKRLTVGIVGVGGTGSAVAQQIARLGIGRLIVADGEEFERSNANRVYGSRVVDDSIKKVKIAERSIDEIGLDTEVNVIPRPISYSDSLAAFRDCDVVFGCTDDEWGRSLLTRLAVYYAIPVLDMGVKIDSDDGVIRSVQGRVTTLLPGTACLYCRGRITADRVRHEVLRATDPEEAERQVEEGYIPELGDPAPAVVAFTTAVAASAVGEFLHRLTGFMGEERESSEVLHLFDVSTTRTNRKQSLESCFCAGKGHESSKWCRGDTKPLLDTIWRVE